MSDETKAPNNCTSLIARKMNKEEIAYRSNMSPRPVEIHYGRYVRAMYNTHLLGIIEWENPNYLRIAQEDERLHAECMRGECQLYGKARWRQIARNLDVPYEDVAYQLRR